MLRTCLNRLPRLLPNTHPAPLRSIVTTLPRNGIEEFFPPGVYEGKNHVEMEPDVGRSWLKNELRKKSNSDLHKLWYILLKERNMMMTLRHECERLGIPCPGPSRLSMVIKSMSNLKFVVDERNDAVRELEKERRYRFDDKRELILEAQYPPPPLSDIGSRTIVAPPPRTVVEEESEEELPEVVEEGEPSRHSTNTQ